MRAEKFGAVVLILAGVMASGASAAVSYLECSKIGSSGRSALFPDQIIIARDGNSRSVTVADSGGTRSRQLPAAGRVQRETGSKLKVAWRRKVEVDTQGNTGAPVFFTLELDKSANTARVSRRALPTNTEASFKARCAPMAAARVVQIEKLLRNPRLSKQLKEDRAFLGRFACTLAKKKTGLAFLPTRFDFELPKDGRDAVVTDAFSKKHTGAKVAAKMDNEHWPDTRVTWGLSGMSRQDMAGASSTMRTGTVLMQANVNRNTGKFSLRVRLDPTAAPKTYRGVCKKAR